ncbi:MULTISPECIES: nuclear transport factor 2 family protein [Niastella]|uniref:Nuclear transport factor 2 family protein n=1 Tax=Niastella soli TaxID=2821487 RepID=A0ABS3YZY1_9BACT|nr:nuclear transport factor 2 family protein [Niastella soli]MBO9203489.1 nuclear transport factor 2 family protein [Niastella soli]
MKRIFLITLLACSWWATKAQNTVKMETMHADSAAISQILEKLYFKGIYEGDLDLLKQVYYKGTLLFGDVKGQPYAKTLDEYLTGVANRQSPKNSGKPFKGEVLSVRVTNSIAVAEVKVIMYDFVYQEYLSFHKIDGQWLLVNKMISDIAQDASSLTKDKVTKGGKKFNLIATIEILPGFEAAVKKAMVTMAAETRKEAGVELFLINTKKDSPQTILIYETYRSEADFELHKTLPHSKVFFEFVKGKIKDDKIGVNLLTGIDN